MANKVLIPVGRKSQCGVLSFGDREVVIEIRLLAGQTGGSNPDRRKNISPPFTSQPDSGVHPASY